MISYNDLYELLRKEKYSELLQQLPKNFVMEMAEFIRERKQQSSQEDDIFAEAILKNKKQFENALAILKELMRIRKKKLLNIVFVATETGMMKRDYENMLVNEKDLFDKLVKGLEESDKEFIKSLNGAKEVAQVEKNKMILFNQDVEQFVDLTGSLIGPFLTGQLANIEQEIAQILVSGGKARFVDEQ